MCELHRPLPYRKQALWLQPCGSICGPANGRNRRILPVSARPGEGHLAEPIADVQTARREPLFMPEAVEKRVIRR